jgi:hypothetical protein
MAPNLNVDQASHVTGIDAGPYTSDDAELRTLTHAAIGAIQSTLFHKGGLPTEQLADLVCACAEAVLFSGIEPVSDQPPHDTGRR